MAAYMLVQARITDEERYGQYRRAVVPLITAAGGKPVGGGSVEWLEGEPDERQTVLFEFPSMEAIRSFWNSPEYGPVKDLRRDAAILEVWAVPGR